MGLAVAGSLCLPGTAHFFLLLRPVQAVFFACVEYLLLRLAVPAPSRVMWLILAWHLTAAGHAGLAVYRLNRRGGSSFGAEDRALPTA